MIGSQEFEAESLAVEIFDCNDFVILPPLQDTKFQKDQKLEPISFGATVTSEDCKVDKYSLTGEMEGLSLDSESGELNVNTQNPSESTNLQLQLTVGSQSIASKTFKFEIFDCLEGAAFPNLDVNYKFQKQDNER